MIERVLQRGAGALRSPDWAAVVPAACAIHCMLVPVFASVLPLIAHDERLEWGMLGFALVLATISLRITWPSHRHPGVPVLVLIGFGIWTSSLLGVFAPVSHTLTNAAGGFLLAGAMFWNGRLRHEAAACSECGRIHD